MTEYTVHFQKGSRVGARSLRMITVTASDAKTAERDAKKQFTEPSYRITRVDHFDGDSHRLIIDR